MPSFIDLHTHTTKSDGSMTPSELVRYAEESGLCAIAITDHDSVDGLCEAHEAAQGLDIEVIDGIEFSAQYENELHILGLYIDPYAAMLQGAMHEMKDKRVARNEKLIKRLNDMGLSITRDDVLLKKADGNMAEVGRVHIALALIEKGIVSSIGEAFEKYLAKDAGAYVERERFSPKKCIEIIKNSGGYAFLAHPICSQKDPDKLEALVDELVSYGLDGIECYHSKHTYELSEFYESICKNRSLMICGGSDFHGANSPGVHIGQANDARYIELDILDDIKRKIGKY